MKIPVVVEPSAAEPPAVEYRWDVDTDILTATLDGQRDGEGLSGSIGLEGVDGSWVVLAVTRGAIDGVEVAVWPDVVTRRGLAPPNGVETVRVVVPARSSQPGIAALEMNTAMLAESDVDERVIHFRLGSGSAARTVRIGRGLLLDLDSQSRIVGLWLLDVPPFPSTAATS